MKILYVDDNERDLARIAEQFEGRDMTLVRTPDEFRAAASGISEPFIALIDHDLKTTEVGYDLCGWLRKEHPYGILLPIVYLTGRDSEQHFLQKMRELPYAVPSAFVHKDNRQALDTLVPNLEIRFMSALTELRHQMARAAVLELERIPRGTDD